MSYEGRLVLRCGRCKKVIKAKPSGWIGDVPYGKRCYELTMRDQAREVNKTVIGGALEPPVVDQKHGTV